MRGGKVMKSTVKRALNTALTKLSVKTRQKAFEAEGETLHYMLFRRRRSNVLVIGFSSVDPKGARYHFVHTLEGVGANRLYILDDFTKHGNYYLGRKNQYNIEKAVFQLIDEMIGRVGAKKLIFIGSSKGGYAAINFGIRYPGSVMVVAAPQYYVGRYMKTLKKLQEGLVDILEDPVTDEKIAVLDQRLPDKMKRNELGSTQKLYMHCSTCEFTYDEHVKDLMEDAGAVGMTIIFDEHSYTDHNDLRFYFPEFLVNSVKKEIKEHNDGAEA